jgi:TRAP-type C4-dicarboxylate transport system permease small subunit
VTRRLEAAAALWALAGGLILVAIVLVTTTNAAAFLADRVAAPFGGSVAGLSGYEDFVRLTISGAALMFLPWCQAQRGHVAVDLFVSRLPAGGRRALDRLWLVLLALTSLFLAGWMAVGLLEARADGTASFLLGWPEWPFYAPGVLSLVLWAAVAAAQAVEGRTREDAHGA